MSALPFMTVKDLKVSLSEFPDDTLVVVPRGAFFAEPTLSKIKLVRCSGYNQDLWEFTHRDSIAINSIVIK